LTEKPFEMPPAGKVVAALWTLPALIAGAERQLVEATIASRDAIDHAVDEVEIAREHLREKQDAVLLLDLTRSKEERVLSGPNAETREAQLREAAAKEQEAVRAADYALAKAKRVGEERVLRAKAELRKLQVQFEAMKSIAELLTE
jgi:hypothetical protein